MTRTALIILALLLTMAAEAQQRSKAQLQAKARQVLSQAGIAPKGKPAELKRTDHYAVYGYQQGGFAIMAASNLLPEVLGYSDRPFGQQPNPNLQWYLNQIDTVAAQAAHSGKGVRRAAGPDTSRFPQSVPALCTSTWGQEAPYWNLCPQDQRYGYCYTGCVATAMAQVLYYHKYPPHGKGERTITYPLDGTTVKATVTANFGTTEYDWDHMRDSYAGNYTEQEAQAVATLMMHCGVAARMNYSVSGSGTYTAEAAYGLREYFGITTARAYYRADYATSDWMDMIYTELSEHRPIVFGATDRQQGFGHAFVFDGYNAQGQVHVNWGWDGDANGYYSIDVLDPQTYHFNDDHDMITGIYGKPMDLLTATIDLSEPGQLAATIDDEAAIGYADLTITGTIDGSDLRRLRYMAGRDEQGRTTPGNLRRLDLSQARIVSGGDAFLTEGGEQYVTADDELPAHAFYGCQTLESITLPTGLKHWGRGALAMCMKLEEVIVEPADDADFCVNDGLVTDTQRQTVLAVLPSAPARLKLPVGITAIDDYAMAGCTRLLTLRLPSTLASVGAYAFYYCSGLTEVRCYALTPPSLGASAFGSVDTGKCRLAVRRDMTPYYKASMGWNIFNSNMREFYTIITPRSATREYGDENPEFGYQLEGDDVEGEPLLSTDAEPTSPVGRYTITASQGTIDDEAVEFGQATLIVRRAPLTLRPADAERRQGEPNPDFSLVYTGLKNDETEPAFTTPPTIECDADELSPEGQYAITVSGGEAPNYSLSYEQGVLTVSPASPDAIGPTQLTVTAATGLYDLQGRRVTRAEASSFTLKKGIYVLRTAEGRSSGTNGKKIIIK